MLSQLILRSVGTFAAACLPLVALAQPAGVAWRTNLDQAKIEAAQSNRLLLLHFTARTCGPCKMLDQNVFSQPQVAAAIEQQYVPVRVDADASPAIAAAFRIDRVPTELIMTPEGNVLANPPIPDKAEPYVAQLQNMARHFRQTAVTPASTSAAVANVNPAYAGLPVSAPASAATAATPGNSAPPQTQPAPAPQVNNATPQQSQPQAQANPYVSAASDPRYGQARNVYGAPPQPMQPPQQQAPQQQPPQVASQPAVPPASQTIAPPAAVAPPSAAAATVATTVPSTPGAATAPAPAGAAATVAAAPPKPQKPQLPPGSPPLAFDGCCSVTLKTLNRWAVGDAQFGAVHRGRTYLFAGAQQRDQFLAAPDAYSPVFAGLDPVMLIDKQQAVEGTRALGYRYGDAFYLFSSKETMQKFKEAPHTYAAGVRQAMNRIDASGGGTIRR